MKSSAGRLGALAGVVIAPFAARRLGKKPACLITFFAGILPTTIPIGPRLQGVMAPDSSPWAPIADQVATGPLSLIGLLIVISMLADVVEQLQVKTGLRAEGVLFAADSLLRKFSTSFAVTLPGVPPNLVKVPRRAKPGHIDSTIPTLGAR